MGIFICLLSKISWACEALLHELITINHIIRQWVQAHRHRADLTAKPALVTHLPSSGSEVCRSWCTHTLLEQRFLSLSNTSEGCQNTLNMVQSWVRKVVGKYGKGSQAVQKAENELWQINKVQLFHWFYTYCSSTKSVWWYRTCILVRCTIIFSITKKVRYCNVQKCSECFCVPLLVK